ncbi:hypothetical protein [Streptosporangium sp. NPDC000396]
MKVARLPTPDTGDLREDLQTLLKETFAAQLAVTALASNDQVPDAL